MKIVDDERYLYKKTIRSAILCSHSTNEFWNFDVLGDILVWKVQLLTLEEEASSMTFNSTDKLSIYSIQVPVSMVH